MGIYSEINRIVKKAQLVVPPIYKPNVYQQGANNIMRKGRDLGWGTFGAAAGLAKSVLDREWKVPISAIASITGISPITSIPGSITVGKEQPEGSWWDYLRAGWNAGHDNADLMTASMIEGAGNTIPFVKFNAPSRYADRIQKMKIDKGMSPEDAATMRDRASSGGEMAASLPLWNGAGKALNSLGRYAGKFIKKVNPKTLGRFFEYFGPVPVMAGEQVIEDNKTSKRIEAKKRMLENAEKNNLVDARKPLFP